MNSLLMNINKKLIFILLTVLVVSLLNFWIYWIFEYNFFLGEILVIETMMLFISILFQKDRIIIILIFMILSFLSFSLLKNHLDNNIFSVSTVESTRIIRRQQFYANELGKIYQNRIGIFYFDNLRLIFSKLSSNFFSALDLGRYFSPTSLLEYEKFPLICAPFFIIGLLYLFAKIKIIPLIYLLVTLIVSSFTTLDAKLAPLLVFPFISCCIALGFIKLLGSIKVLSKLI